MKKIDEAGGLEYVLSLPNLVATAANIEYHATFQHRAGVSPYTSAFALAETCVFAKQLLGPILCGLLSQAPLLPKLRGQFA